MIRNLASALIVLFCISACSGDLSRSDVLANLAEESVVPAYTALDEAADDLAGAITSLCDAPSTDNLVTAQTLVATMRAAWAEAEAMWVGPVMDRRSWAVIDWPVAEIEIDDLLADATIVLDTERIGSRIGADQRGLGAVEYLLAGAEAIDNGAYDDPRRCDYLGSLAAVMAQETALLINDWTQSYDEDAAYSERFANVDEANSLDALVNDSLFLLEAMTDAQLGRALGVMGEAKLEAIVEGRQGLGVAVLESQLAGLRLVLVGGVGNTGLAPLLGEDLRTRLLQQLDAAQVALRAVDGPLRQAITEDTDDVAAVRDALKAIQVTIATEVVSTLGVTVGFSDADGDSSG